MKALAVVGGFVIFVLAMLLSGWVLCVTWGWFVVPVFGLPSLRVAQAMGLCLVTRVLAGAHADTSKESWGVQLTTAVVTPLLTLGIAWIIHLFV